MLRNVVLPEPDGPVTATNSPALTSSVRSRTAWVSTIAVRNTFDTSFMCNIKTPNSKSARAVHY